MSIKQPIVMGIRIILILKSGFRKKSFIINDLLQNPYFSRPTISYRYVCMLMIFDSCFQIWPMMPSTSLIPYPSAPLQVCILSTTYNTNEELHSFSRGLLYKCWVATQKCGLLRHRMCDVRAERGFELCMILMGDFIGGAVPLGYGYGVDLPIECLNLNVFCLSQSTELT